MYNYVAGICWTHVDFPCEISAYLEVITWSASASLANFDITKLVVNPICKLIVGSRLCLWMFYSEKLNCGGLVNLRGFVHITVGTPLKILDIKESYAYIFLFLSLNVLYFIILTLLDLF